MKIVEDYLSEEELPKGISKPRVVEYYELNEEGDIISLETNESPLEDYKAALKFYEESSPSIRRSTENLKREIIKREKRFETYGFIYLFLHTPSFIDLEYKSLKGIWNYNREIRKYMGFLKKLNGELDNIKGFKEILTPRVDGEDKENLEKGAEIIQELRAGTIDYLELLYNTKETLKSL